MFIQKGKDGHGIGGNLAGKIFERIRSDNRPNFICVGDSTIENVADKCTEAIFEICCVPNGNLQKISQLAKFIANIPRKGIVLCAGVNNIVGEKKEYRENVVSVCVLTIICFKSK